MTRRFEITWDYRCPFARIVHDHVLQGIAAGADWEVRFRAFSLDQPHLDEGQAPVWERPQEFPGMLANLVGVAVRDRFGDHFLELHRTLFSARHDLAMDIKDRQVLAKLIESAGLDPVEVFEEVDSGRPAVTLGQEHADAVERLEVFGVPTFVVGEKATFVRLMRSSGDDPQQSVATVERVLDLIESWPELNEFKHTTIAN
jgi:hypothetical protein